MTALAIGLAACGSSNKGTASNPPAASGTAQITIDSAFKFNVTPVKAGSTVTVKNTSSSQHTVTQDGGGFKVTIDAGKTATFTAPAAGSYKFHCNIHNFMKGTLTVS
ncbi:MAG TPA: cupredoxin domain-containing protein [Acidimicrobiia bacterium]|nr:cupredoxin domain-containing protein [Acidimicrobiia bacterium]